MSIVGYARPSSNLAPTPFIHLDVELLRRGLDPLPRRIPLVVGDLLHLAEPGDRVPHMASMIDPRRNSRWIDEEGQTIFDFGDVSWIIEVQNGLSKSGDEDEATGAPVMPTSPSPLPAALVKETGLAIEPNARRELEDLRRLDVAVEVCAAAGEPDRRSWPRCTRRRAASTPRLRVMSRAKLSSAALCGRWTTIGMPEAVRESATRSAPSTTSTVRDRSQRKEPADDDLVRDQGMARRDHLPGCAPVRGVTSMARLPRDRVMHSSAKDQR